jgi:hypothetical protein
MLASVKHFSLFCRSIIDDEKSYITSLFGWWQKKYLSKMKFYSTPFFLFHFHLLANTMHKHDKKALKNKTIYICIYNYKIYLSITVCHLIYGSTLVGYKLACFAYNYLLWCGVFKFPIGNFENVKVAAPRPPVFAISTCTLLLSLCLE